MEHVKLGRRHAVELAQNVRQRQEMTRRIQQNAAPREARHVADIHQRQEGILPVGLQQLQQGFHAAQRAETRVGAQRGTLRRDRQPVTLIAARQRLRRHPVLDQHLDRRAVRFFHRRQRPAGLQFDALAPARQRVAQIVALQRQRQTVIQHQLARRLRHFHLLRPGISGRSPAGCASAPQENHNDEASSV